MAVSTGVAALTAAGADQGRLAGACACRGRRLRRGGGRGGRRRVLARLGGLAVLARLGGLTVLSRRVLSGRVLG